MLTGFGSFIAYLKVKVLTVILCVLVVLISCAMGGCVSTVNGVYLNTIKDDQDLMSCMLVGEKRSSYFEPYFSWEQYGDHWLLWNNKGCAWEVWLEFGTVTKAKMYAGPCDFNRKAFMKYARERGCI